MWGIIPGRNHHSQDLKCAVYPSYFIAKILEREVLVICFVA